MDIAVNSMQSVRKLLRAMAELRAEKLHATAMLLEERVIKAYPDAVIKNQMNGNVELWDRSGFLIASSTETV